MNVYYNRIFLTLLKKKSPVPINKQSTVFKEQSAWCFASLLFSLFKIYYLTFNILSTIVLGVLLFVIILHAVCWGSWVFIKFGDIFSLYFLSIYSVPCFLLLLVVGPTTWCPPFFETVTLSSFFIVADCLISFDLSSSSLIFFFCQLKSTIELL